MPINSRQKGARCEREAAELFRDQGYDGARRGCQFSGGEDSPDIVVPGLEHIHFEVKAVQNLNVHNALAQAVRDGGPTKVPVVLHKKNGTGWLVTMRGEDWFNFLEAYQKYEKSIPLPVPHPPIADSSVG